MLLAPELNDAPGVSGIIPLTTPERCNILRPRYLRRKPRIRPVTIIVGIKCRGSIVLASDSQTTYPDHSKRRDSEKISVVNFEEGDKALVAQSGHVETSARIVAVMARLASNRKNDGAEAVLKTMQDALWEVRGELRRQHFDCPAEEFAEVVFKEGLDCSLMVGHFYNNNAYLNSFSFKSASTTPTTSQYESLGCGSALANYLLGELVSPDMDTNFGKALAVYVVDKTIQNVAHCDKPIRLAVLYPWKPRSRPGLSASDLEGPYSAGETLRSKETQVVPPIVLDNVEVLDVKEVEEIERKVAAIDAETKQDRVEKLKSALWSYADTLPKIPNYGLNSPSDDSTGLDDLYK